MRMSPFMRPVRIRPAALVRARASRKPDRLATVRDCRALRVAMDWQAVERYLTQAQTDPGRGRGCLPARLVPLPEYRRRGSRPQDARRPWLRATPGQTARRATEPRRYRTPERVPARRGGTPETRIGR